MAVAFDKASTTGSTTATTIAITPATAGNAIFVVVWDGAAGTWGVTDNKNTGAYTSVGAQFANSVHSQWFYHLNCAASATTLTVTGTSAPGMIAYSLSGVAATTPTASYETGTGTTTALTTPNVTITNAGSMILASWGDGNATSVTPWISNGTNYATSANENMFYVPAGAEHYTGSATGSVAVTATALNTTTTWSGSSFVINPVVTVTSVKGEWSFFGVGQT